MSDVYLDHGVADDTGTAPSDYWTAALGEATNAYKTFISAEAVADNEANSVIHIRPGTYLEAANVLVSGNPMTFRLYGDVTIDAGGGAYNVLSHIADLTVDAGNGRCVFRLTNTSKSGNLYGLVSSNADLTWTQDVILKIDNTIHGWQHRSTTTALVLRGSTLIVQDSLSVGFGIYSFNDANSIDMEIDGFVICDVGVNLLNDRANTRYIFHSGLFCDPGGGQFSIANNTANAEIELNNAIMVSGADHQLNETVLQGTHSVAAVANANNCYAGYPWEAYTGDRAESGWNLNNDIKEYGEQPKFLTARRRGMISLIVDDTANWELLPQIYERANLYGFPLINAIGGEGHTTDNDGDEQDPSLATDAFWAFQLARVREGHMPCLHTMNNVNLVGNDAFSIVYPGNVAIDVSADTLTTSGGSNDLTFTLSDYFNCKALVAAIDAETGYVASLEVHQYAGSEQVTSLADMAATDATGGLDIPIDYSRMIAEEITALQDQIETQLGVRPTCLVYPGHNSSTTRAAALETAGIRLARGELSPGTMYSNLGQPAKPFESLAVLGKQLSVVVPSAALTDDQIKRNIWNICDYACLMGAYVCLYSHYSTPLGADYPVAQWKVVLDALNEHGNVDVVTMEQAADWILHHPQVTKTAGGDGQPQYLIDFTDVDLAWSPAILNTLNYPEGGIRSWTGRNPVGVDGEPFADWSTGIGAVQSRAGPFHPSNL